MANVAEPAAALENLNLSVEDVDRRRCLVLESLGADLRDDVVELVDAMVQKGLVVDA